VCLVVNLSEFRLYGTSCLGVPDSSAVTNFTPLRFAKPIAPSIFRNPSSGRHFLTTFRLTASLFPHNSVPLKTVTPFDYSLSAILKLSLGLAWLYVSGDEHLHKRGQP
jgi:hypothetical protein